jgi:hypothetical protein
LPGLTHVDGDSAPVARPCAHRAGRRRLPRARTCAAAAPLLQCARLGLRRRLVALLLLLLLLWLRRRRGAPLHACLPPLMLLLSLLLLLLPLKVLLQLLKANAARPRRPCDRRRTARDLQAAAPAATG